MFTGLAKVYFLSYNMIECRLKEKNIFYFIFKLVTGQMKKIPQL